MATTVFLVAVSLLAVQRAKRGGNAAPSVGVRRPEALSRDSALVVVAHAVALLTMVVTNP